MKRWLQVAHALSLSLLLGCDPASATIPDAGPDDPDAAGAVDAAAVDAAALDPVADASGILRDGGGDSGMCTPETCAAVLGIPPVPEHPCGWCWATCYDERACGMVCFEAQTCVFTAGCGPMCEPLCDTTEDCLLDDICIEGICVPPEDSGETS